MERPGAGAPRDSGKAGEPRNSALLTAAHAVWVPYWYELDSPISVGGPQSIVFFREIPTQLRALGDLVFFHGPFSPENAATATATIVAIRHAPLGNLRAIATRGLEYRFVREDGEEVLVEAEETPGTAAEVRYRDIRDWHVYVELRGVQFA